jgi:hypothetical protein
MKTEKCPYHDIEPEYWLRIFRNRMEKTWTDKAGEKHVLVLPQLADHYYFCPECRKIIYPDAETQDGPPLKTKKHALTSSDDANMAKLAFGYCSGKSKAIALSNWNKAIVNMTVKIFKKVVSGK